MLILNHSTCIQINISSHLQHEQNSSYQDRHIKHVSNFCHTIFGMGNPFQDTCSELLALDTCNCASNEVVNTTRVIDKLGTSQYHNYVKEVIFKGKTSIHHSIKRNNLALFKNVKAMPRFKEKVKLSALKISVNFITLLVSSEVATWMSYFLIRTLFILRLFPKKANSICRYRNLTYWA